MPEQVGVDEFWVSVRDLAYIPGWQYGSLGRPPYFTPRVTNMAEQEGAMWTIIRKVGRIEHKREVHERFLPPELVEQLKKVLHP